MRSREVTDGGRACRAVDCPEHATHPRRPPRVETSSTPEEIPADVDVQRLGGPRIFVISTRPLPFGDGKITPFLTNVSFDVMAVC